MNECVELTSSRKDFSEGRSGSNEHSLSRRGDKAYYEGRSYRGPSILRTFVRLIGLIMVFKIGYGVSCGLRPQDTPYPISPLFYGGDTKTLCSEPFPPLECRPGSLLGDYVLYGKAA